jgi:hypothetical protein
MYFHPMRPSPSEHDFMGSENKFINYRYLPNSQRSSKIQVNLKMRCARILINKSLLPYVAHHFTKDFPRHHRQLRENFSATISAKSGSSSTACLSNHLSSCWALSPGHPRSPSIAIASVDQGEKHRSQSRRRAVNFV